MRLKKKNNSVVIYQYLSRTPDFRQNIGFDGSSEIDEVSHNNNRILISLFSLR